MLITLTKWAFLSFYLFVMYGKNAKLVFLPFTFRLYF